MPDWSCTRPGMRPLNSARSGITYRPCRCVTIASCRYGALRRGADDALQAVHQPRMRLAQFPPDAHQRVARRIQHLAALVDAAGDLVDHVARHDHACATSAMFGNCSDSRPSIRLSMRAAYQRAAEWSTGPSGAAGCRSWPARPADGGHARRPGARRSSRPAAGAPRGSPPARPSPGGYRRSGASDSARCRPRENEVCSASRAANLVEFEHAESPGIHAAQYSTGARTRPIFSPFSVLWYHGCCFFLVLFARSYVEDRG